MIDELSTGVWTTDLPRHNLGTVVLMYQCGGGYTGYIVELTTLSGETITVETLVTEQMWPNRVSELEATLREAYTVDEDEERGNGLKGGMNRGASQRVYERRVVERRNEYMSDEWASFDAHEPHEHEHGKQIGAPVCATPSLDSRPETSNGLPWGEYVACEYAAPRRIALYVVGGGDSYCGLIAPAPSGYTWRQQTRGLLCA